MASFSLIRAEFTWDEVKVDKHRENYIGHSLKAPVGRWQKGRDFPLPFVPSICVFPLLSHVNDFLSLCKCHNPDYVVINLPCLLEPILLVGLVTLEI